MMNNPCKEIGLYIDLMRLAETNEAFYFKDFPAHNSGVYRIFNYRLAQYSDWLLPSALEASGIMFHVLDDVVTLVCRPMEKFFNDYENPLAENLDYTNIKQAMYKCAMWREIGVRCCQVSDGDF